ATTLDECLVVSEPLGVVFIAGAWCSPVQQALGPLVGAIAAGNCALISPYEHASNTAELLQRLLPSYLDSECYHVVFAGGNNLAELLELKFDHIFFIGSRGDGSRVAQAAACTLTPVTLVLGGKNPCYVDQRCDLAATAHRIAWARFHNAGQSLAAPGYVLCHAEVRDRLVQALKCSVMQFYGTDPQESHSFGRMANAESFGRTRDLLWRSGKVVVGGQAIEAEKYIGASGMGSYHGRSSFDTFSHRKSCLLRGTRFEVVTYLRYPPYEDRNLSLMTWASALSQKSQGWCQLPVRRLRQGWGKAILHGEHAVVHGKVALAVSLNLRTYLELKATSTGKVSIDLPNIDTFLSWDVSELKLLASDSFGKQEETKLLDAELLQRLREFVGVTNGNLDTRSMATLAFLYIYLSLFGSGRLFLNAVVHRWCQEDMELINSWAFQGEKIIHGNPSGVDNAVGTWGKGGGTWGKGGGTRGGMLKFLSGKIIPLSRSFPSIINPVLDSVDAISCTCEKTLAEMTSEPITGEHYNVLETYECQETDSAVVQSTVQDLRDCGYDCWETSIGGPGVQQHSPASVREEVLERLNPH
ncbi:hypothetical protein CRUP_001228, partial [Coryphaenoides rupestris]